MFQRLLKCPFLTSDSSSVDGELDQSLLHYRIPLGVSLFPGSWSILPGAVFESATLAGKNVLGIGCLCVCVCQHLWCMQGLEVFCQCLTDLWVCWVCVRLCVSVYFCLSVSVRVFVSASLTGV